MRRALRLLTVRRVAPSSVPRTVPHPGGCRQHGDLAGPRGIVRDAIPAEDPPDAPGIDDPEFQRLRATAAAKDLGVAESVALCRAWARLSAPQRASLLGAMARATRPSDSSDQAAPTRWFEQVTPLPHGLRFLLGLRAELPALAERHPDLAATSRGLTDHLRPLFLPGWLWIQSITADSPPRTRAAVQTTDGVHPMSDPESLLPRLAPTLNRRCYGLFHLLEPAVPLCAVQVALLPEPPGTVRPIFQPSDAPCDRSCAVFYSINTTQRGLAGVPLGRLMILAAAGELRAGGVPHHYTLSPVPGLRAWVQGAPPEDTDGLWRSLPGCQEDVAKAAAIVGFPAAGDPVTTLRGIIAAPGWASDAVMPLLRPLLLRLALGYLCPAGCRARDPVQHFHLSNGAALWRVNVDADRSPPRLEESCGVMVNYAYESSPLDGRRGAYLRHGALALGPPADAQFRAADFLPPPP